MGYWEALRRRLSEIYGRPIAEDDNAIFKYYRGAAPTSGTVLFPGHVFTPATAPPGYEYYTDTNGKVAVKCKHNTSGALTVTEASAAGIATTMNYLSYSNIVQQHPTVNTQISVSVAADAANGHIRIGRAVATCAGGAFANLILAPDPTTAYYPVVKLIGIVNLTSTIAAGATLTFESPAGTALTVMPTITLPALTAGTISKALEGIHVWQGTDNEALVVDGAGFGAADDIGFFYEYWYET